MSAQAFPAALPPFPPEQRQAGRAMRGALRLLLGLFMAFCGLLVLAMVGLESGPVIFGLALTLALLPVPFWLWVFLRLDRFEPEPTRQLLFAFAWGACVATFVALIVNTIFSVIVAESLGEDAAELYGGSISAPVIEELAKGFAIYAVYRFRRFEFDGVLDGIVYAGMVGLGFAMTENVLYYAQGAIELGLVGALGTFVLRGLMSPLAHPLFTIPIGVGFGIASRSRSGVVRFGAPLIGLGIAMALHSAWNTAAAFGDVFFTVYLLVMVPCLCIAFALVGFERRREARVIGQQLAPLVASGALAQDDVRLLSSARARRNARRRMKAQHGKPAREVLDDAFLAAAEYALARDRFARGTVRQKDAAALREREVSYYHALLARRPALRAAAS